MLAGQRDRVPDLRLMHILQAGDQIADLAGTEDVHGRRLGRHHAGLLGLGLDLGRHEADAGAAGQLALLHPKVGDHPAIRIEHRIEDQCLEGLVGVAGGWRNLTYDGLK